MDEIGGELLIDYRTILAPFALLTSCATLVWSLQTRYSRVVHAIRLLAAERRAASDEQDRSALLDQIEILRRRAGILRNGVVGHYLAMGCFLATAVLLALSVNLGWSLAMPIVACFFTGLILVWWTMANSVFDAFQSFDAVGAELRCRAPMACVVEKDVTRGTF